MIFGDTTGIRILAAPSCSLITSLFSTASDECAISSESWFALSSQVAEAKHVAGNESYVGTKDSERLSLRRRCIREVDVVGNFVGIVNHSDARLNPIPVEFWPPAGPVDFESALR